MSEKKLIEYTHDGQSLNFRVQVVPRASRSEIVGEHNGVLKVRIAAPPVAGAANDELLVVVARALGVARNSIEISAGHGSRNKRLRVAGVAPIALEKLLHERQKKAHD